MSKGKKSGKTWLIILGVILAIIVILVVLGIVFLPKTILLEDSQIFDKQTVKQRAEEVIGTVSMDDYSTLLTVYANETLEQGLSMETMRSAKEGINSNWGLMQQIISENYYETEQNKITYALAIIEVQYENVAVTYTLSFDTDMKLAGIYLK